VLGGRCPAPEKDTYPLGAWFALQNSTPSRVLREDLHRGVLIAVNSVRYFFRIARGDFRDLNRAPISSKRAFSLSRRAEDQPLVVTSLPSPDDVWKSAEETFRERGIWPISFSYPKEISIRPQESSSGLCPIYPGHSYSFTGDEKYLETYGSYAFALTHKKAGWDCFRHVEICYAGAIPYMPDASLIPKHTMVHYPKDFFVQVAEHLRVKTAIAEGEVERRLAEYFNRHLTTRAMARYLVQAAPCLGEGRVLFVDEAAVGMPDYQSILTLIGLKQLFGAQISVAYPLDYVYEDWRGKPSELYGRGFGYSRVLGNEMKNENEVAGTESGLSREALAAFDAIVVGSITRNVDLAHKLLDIYPPEKTVWIHGEDDGPTATEIAAYRKAGVTAFAREL